MSHEEIASRDRWYFPRAS